MRTKKNIEQAALSTVEKKKRRPGRQPMTAEQKEAAAKARAEEKEKADNLKPDVVVQYQDVEVEVVSLVEAAKADFHQTKNAPSSRI